MPNLLLILEPQPFVFLGADVVRLDDIIGHHLPVNLDQKRYAPAAAGTRTEALRQL